MLKWCLVFAERASVRAVLYSGALVGAYKNPVRRTCCQRLLASGKPKKVAPTDCM